MRPAAFIAGDRQSDGIFNLWSIGANVTIAPCARSEARAHRQRAREPPGADWKERIGIRTPDMNNNILTLSGGNQQKTLFARALGSKADIVLMDDPMRGVDVGTKLEVYDMIRAEAERGRSFIWYTTEIDELQHCDRAYVFRNGAIVAELGRPTDRREGAPCLLRAKGSASMTPQPAALAAASIIPASLWSLAATFYAQPRTMSYFGLNLMLQYAVPIALATIAQMFIITVNDLDLSIGPFVGLVGCIGATF